ncbi:hypothetical protein Hanom_Chr03g00208741 [Helianthus anomalus]
MFYVLVLGFFSIKVILKITFTLPFTIHLKSVRPAVQFKFIWFLIDVKMCQYSFLSIFLLVSILNQKNLDRNPTA